jgi:hypothetical protein
MKKLHLIPLLILFLNVGCKKDPSISSPPPIQTPPPVNSANTAPYVSTGNDIFIVLPSDSCVLKGSAYDENDNICKYLWKQVSGSSTVVIETPDSLTTKLRNLKKGTYTFELIVSDKGGLTGKDIAIVSVLETGSGINEVGFNNLQIRCPLECSVMLENFSSLNPDNLVFKIYVKKAQDPTWIEIKPSTQWTPGDKYSYNIYKNNLWIYSDNESTVDVKITY